MGVSANTWSATSAQMFRVSVAQLARLTLIVIDGTAPLLSALGLRTVTSA